MEVFSQASLGAKVVLNRLGLDERTRGEVAYFVRGLLSDVRALGRRAPTDAAYLHIGCGGERLPGFVNCDRVLTAATDMVVDLRRPLPFGDSRFRGVFHQHVLEHIDHPEGARGLLKESARVVTPGGYLRIGVPDLDRYVEAYRLNDKEFARGVGLGEIEFAAQIINYAFCHSHRFLYDFDSLRYELERAGFGDVRRADYRDSADNMLNHDNPALARRMETLFVEARRL